MAFTTKNVRLSPFAGPSSQASLGEGFEKFGKIAKCGLDALVNQFVVYGFILMNEDVPHSGYQGETVCQFFRENTLLACQDKSLPV